MTTRLLPALRVLLATLLLALVYSFLPLAAPARFTSPDENANAVFSRSFAESGTLWFVDLLAVQADGLVHPRSVKLVDGMQVPGGFLGLPVIFGGLARLFGTATIPFLTPVLSVFGVLAWGLLLRDRFGSAVGVAGAVLLAAHPAWWYASSRTLYPNVLFCSLVLIGTWLFVATPAYRALNRSNRKDLYVLRVTDPAIAGVLFGLALAVRPVEGYWLLLGGAAMLVAFRGRVSWVRVLTAAVFAFAALVPFGTLQQSLYGGLLNTGYGSGLDVPTGEVGGGFGNRLLGPLRPWLFPLGFAPRTALTNVWHYGLAFFWWWSIAVIAAVIVYFRGRAASAVSRDVRATLAAGGAIAVWLALFYGSWVVRDNPDPNAVTIGSSYLRYWLPVFVLSTLPVAWAAGRLWAMPSRRPWLLAAFAAFVAVSGLTVFRAPGEGLLAVRAELRKYDAIVADILVRTPEPNALIITDRADKYLYPQRQVVVPLRSEATYAALQRLSRFSTLYYYGITLPEGDLAHLREVRLYPQHLEISPVASYGPETLYRLTPRSQ